MYREITHLRPNLNNDTEMKKSVLFLLNKTVTVEQLPNKILFKPNKADFWYVTTYTVYKAPNTPF